MTQPSPTPEQQAILDAVRDDTRSVMVTAFAGCAKTTTLEMIAKAIPQGSPALALAFNVKIKTELAKRFPGHVSVVTLNGLGHRAWGKAIGKNLIVQPAKLNAVVTDTVKAHHANLSRDQWTNTRKLVQLAMHAGLVPSGRGTRPGLIPDTEESWQRLADDAWIEPWPALIPLARAALAESVARAYAGVISFDDQIYMSALFGGVFPRFPLVMVDEAQDLSPLNHIQVSRSAAGRLIVVGDPKQAIYAFRGADSSSMDSLRQLRPEWIDLPLTTTFRCPRVVVKRQQAHAPGFTAAPSNPEGQLFTWHKKPEGEESRAWTWADFQNIAAEGDVAVLCRNNAPLIALAFKLIRKRVGCTMLGRDIGKGLLDLSRKILPLDDIPAAECSKLITEWQEQQIGLVRANDHEEKIAGITDRAECLLAVLDSALVQDSGALREALASLFARENERVVLSTIHRAKGLEWPTVLHLDPWRIPSKWARRSGNDRQLNQELNLRYVCETRAQQVLLLANLADFS